MHKFATIHAMDIEQALNSKNSTNSQMFIICKIQIDARSQDLMNNQSRSIINHEHQKLP
jgi:hypothetical protein